MDPSAAAWEVVVVVWVISGVIASLISQHKGGKPWGGFWLGLILGTDRRGLRHGGEPEDLSLVSHALWNPAEAAHAERQPPVPPPPPAPDL